MQVNHCYFHSSNDRYPNYRNVAPLLTRIRSIRSAKSINLRSLGSRFRRLFRSCSAAARVGAGRSVGVLSRRRLRRTVARHMANLLARPAKQLSLRRPLHRALLGNVIRLAAIEAPHSARSASAEPARPEAAACAAFLLPSVGHRLVRALACTMA